MGLENLKQHVDTLVIIPNEKLLAMADKKTTLLDSFKLADGVLRQGVQAISDLITIPGVVNADFADIEAVMKDKGLAHMGVGYGKGDNKAQDAVRQAISSPLLETSIDGATGVIINFTGGVDLGAIEVYEAAAYRTDRTENSKFGNYRKRIFYHTGQLLYERRGF